MSQHDQPFQLPIDDDALIDEHQLSGVTQLSLSKLRNDRYMKQGFPFVKIGASARYRVGDVRQKIKESTVETSAT